MNPLEVYNLKQAGRGQYDTGMGPIYSTPTYLQRGHGIENFLAVYSVGLNMFFGKEPRFSVEKRYVLEEKLCPICLRKPCPLVASSIFSRTSQLERWLLKR
jgi:hypothetical protein